MFAEDDAAWRRTHVVPSSEIAARERVTTASGGEWHPSAKQSLDDRVWTLVRQNRLGEAIDLLSSWVGQHPRDGEELLKLARLLNQAGRTEEAIPRYRQLLALEEGRRP
jgi:Flp pilus assembly protein TadD